MQYLNIHTHHQHRNPEEHSILSLSLGHDQIEDNGHPISVGIHPWFAKDTWQQDLALVEDWAMHSQVKMIGECGLDKLQGPPLQEQIDLLEAQLAIAKKVKKPVLIHCVKAYGELIASYKKIDPQVILVIHGFNKKQELAQQLMHQGFVLSFGKALLQSDELASVLRATDFFFLETDDSKHPIEEIYEFAAKIKNVSVDELKALIFDNWKRLGQFQS